MIWRHIPAFIFDQEAFQTGFYKTVNHLLDTPPVSAVVLQHVFDDSQKAVHLTAVKRQERFIT